MASLAASPAGGSEQSAKLDVLKETLYDEMQQHGSAERLYNQKDLIELNIIPNDDVGLLLRVVQGLCDDFLLVSTNDSRSGLAWRWRSREDGRKYRGLPNNEAVMVYALIDEAGADGIWSRTIKAKLKMHESVLKQCIKHLEGKGYITDMKSVEHPNKKMYIRADLRPSDRATGGPWYTDSNLDEAFIVQLEAVVFNFIRFKSSHFREGTKPPRKGVVKGDRERSATAAPADGSSRGEGSSSRPKKRSATEISDEVGPTGTNGTPAPTRQQPQPQPQQQKQGQQPPRRDVFLPYPAGYTRYPTIREVAKYISDVGITNNTTLSESDVQQLVEILVFDGLVEPVRVGSRLGYRVTRIAKQEAPRQGGGDGGGAGADAARLVLGPNPPSNALMEAPCGRCPVFELCEEGGPVSPGNCVYFQRWLGLE